MRCDRGSVLECRATLPRDFGCSPSGFNVKPAYMDWSKHSGGRRGYHHGNLREALIEAALRLIGEKGPGGFPIAEAARAAGVSPAAPYRHFRDGQDLLADVAVRGFEHFAAALRRAWDDGRPAPGTAFERLGRAYLAFARDEPAYDAAMFEAGVRGAARPPLSPARGEKRSPPR